MNSLPTKQKINYFTNTMDGIRYTLGIIEDDRIIREGYKLFFENHPSFDLKYTAENVEDFIQEARKGPEVDIVLSDIGLPGMSGIQGIIEIKKFMPNVQFVMLTVYDDEDKLFKALCAGATGYLLKNMPLTQIGNSLLQIDRGGIAISPSIARKVIRYFHPKKQHEGLTPKESQIVALLVEGYSYKMIADRLLISTHTVNTHIKNIYRKLHVNSKAEVVAMSLKGEI